MALRSAFFFLASASLCACGAEEQADLSGFEASEVQVSRSTLGESPREWSFGVTLFPSADGLGEACPILHEAAVADVAGVALERGGSGGVGDGGRGIGGCKPADFSGRMPAGEPSTFADGTITIRDGSSTIVVTFPGLLGGLVPRESLDGLAPGQEVFFDFVPTGVELDVTLDRVELLGRGESGGARDVPATASGSSVGFRVPDETELGALPEELDVLVGICAKAAATRCEGVPRCEPGGSGSLFCDETRFELRIAR